MTTERMTDEEFSSAIQSAYHGNEDGFHALAQEAQRARRVEQEQAETIQDQARLIVSLREQLRLANDKMAEQVRQARWEVADETLNGSKRDTVDALLTYLEAVRDANAPKD